MRQKNSYSRIIQGLTGWEHTPWAEKIKLFQHSVERDITSFLAVGPNRETLQDNSLGTALSESGLSRDEIQLLGGIRELPKTSDEIISQIEDTLSHLKTDYLDLIFLDLRSPPEIVMPAVDLLFSQGKILETGVYDLQDPSGLSSQSRNSIKANLTNWHFSPATMKDLSQRTWASEVLTEIKWVHLQETEALKTRLEPLSRKYQHTPQEILLAWFLQHPAHFHPVLQGNDKEFLNLAARAHRLTLIKEDWSNLPGDLELK